MKWPGARYLGALAATLALLIGLVPGLVLAQSPPSVVSISPVHPLQPGARTVELGFEVEGAASQVVVSVKGTSTTSGLFADVTRVVVSRDRAGAIPFHTLVPLSAELPADGRLEITATPVVADDTQVTPAQAVLDGRSPAPAFAANAVKVRASQDTGELLVEVGYQGSLARAELTLLGASSQMLRTVKGDMEQAEVSAFALTRRQVARPRLSTPGTVTFAVPVRTGSIPPDGVVVVDVTLVDAYGRAVHTSEVEFTDSPAFDPVLGLRASPAPLLLPDS